MKMNYLNKVFISMLVSCCLISCNYTLSKSRTVSITNDSSTEIEDFDAFYKRFHQDSIFQMSRINFPIQGSYSDYDTTIVWTNSNWEILKYTIDQVDTTEYDIIFEKTKEKVSEQVNCKECGFSFEIGFELLNGKWFLTLRQDNNF